MVVLDTFKGNNICSVGFSCSQNKRLYDWPTAARMNGKWRRRFGIICQLWETEDPVGFQLKGKEEWIWSDWAGKHVRSEWLTSLKQAEEIFTPLHVFIQSLITTQHFHLISSILCFSSLSALIHQASRPAACLSVCLSVQHACLLLHRSHINALFPSLLSRFDPSRSNAKAAGRASVFNQRPWINPDVQRDERHTSQLAAKAPPSDNN